MTEPVIAETAPRRRSGSWRQLPTRLPRPFIDRQGRITHLAFALLGGRDPALAFLNAHHPALGAKPLDVAGQSAAGFAAVEGEMSRLAANAAGDPR